MWADDINYFANAGFDAGYLAINYLKSTLDHLNNVEGPVTGLILKLMDMLRSRFKLCKLKNLGKLTNIRKCNKSMD